MSSIDQKRRGAWLDLESEGDEKYQKMIEAVMTVMISFNANGNLYLRGTFLNSSTGPQKTPTQGVGRIFSAVPDIPHSGMFATVQFPPNIVTARRWGV